MGSAGRLACSGCLGLLRPFMLVVFLHHAVVRWRKLLADLPRRKLHGITDRASSQVRMCESKIVPDKGCQWSPMVQLVESFRECLPRQSPVSLDSSNPTWAIGNVLAQGTLHLKGQRPVRNGGARITNQYCASVDDGRWVGWVLCVPGSE